MVVIRLSAADKTPFIISLLPINAARDGRFIERLGYFNPIAAGKDVALELNLER